MDHTIDTPMALRVMPKTIEAACYNQVRLALCRLGSPLRIALPDHTGLVIILNDRRWLCVDSNHDDLPIMAWSDFDTHRHNQALHAPVPCRLHLYHMHAGLVMGSALDALYLSLLDQLAVEPGG